MADKEEYSENTDNSLTEIAGEEEETTPIKERFPDVPEPVSAQAQAAANKATQIASLRERFAAFVIDTIFLFYLYWVYVAAYGAIFLGSMNPLIPVTGWHAMALHGSFLFVCFLYYIIAEGIFLATIGKFICWMVIRKKNGESASILATLVRNILRPIDYIFIFPVIFLMELTKGHQRLGDLVSGTAVIKKYIKRANVYDISHVASASGRTVAALIDIALFLAFAAGYILLLSPAYSVISRAMLLLAPLVFILYFVIIEMITETSPGMWLFGYIICHDDGRRLGMSGSLTRSLWIPVDMLFGFLPMFLSTKRQRIGDLAAGTILVRHKRHIKGGIAILAALILAGGTLYPGLMNKEGIITKNFRLNFFPRVQYMQDFLKTYLNFNEPQSGEISIQNFRFAANEPTEFRVPATFSGGETVYVIFELKDYAKKDRNVWLQEDLTVTYPDGSIGLSQSNIVDYQQVVKGTAPIEFANNVTLPTTATPGIYKVTVTVRDKFSGSEIKKSEDFFVKRNYLYSPEQAPEEGTTTP